MFLTVTDILQKGWGGDGFWQGTGVLMLAEGFLWK